MRLEGKGLDPRLLVVHGDDGHYHAIANRCTHMGRRIDTIAGSNTLQPSTCFNGTLVAENRGFAGCALHQDQNEDVKLQLSFLLTPMG